MKYRAALTRTAITPATNWQHVPRHAAHAWKEFLPFANAVFILLSLVVSPLLAVLSPLIALAVMADDRKQKRDREAAIRRINEHYGSMRQKP